MDGQRDKLADGLLLVCVALNIQVFQPRCPLCLGLQRATLQLLAAGNPPTGQSGQHWRRRVHCHRLFIYLEQPPLRYLPDLPNQSTANHRLLSLAGHGAASGGPGGP